MTEKRLAVVGAGVMGGNHIRVANENSEFKITYVVDKDQERAAERAASVGAVAVSEVEDIQLDAIDAAIVAAPSHLHGKIGKHLLSNGIHVLMEKPLSLDLEEAEMLDAVSSENRTQLMVGHIELFNPTVTALKSEIGGRPIRSFRAERLGLVEDPSRLYHGVVDDLMIHDIAIARYLFDKDPSSEARVVAAIGSNNKPASPDPAQSFLRFGDSDAYFRSSRVYGGGKKRMVEVELEDGSTIQADLLGRTILNHRSIQTVDSKGDQYQTTETREIIPHPVEPLKSEHSFFSALIDGREHASDKGVSAQDAIAILAITTAINQYITEVES